ncbi:LysM peptidoglycan-binding domain-containing protein [Zeaxanthinibacter sp. PT1]|uniref:LysM peptidoglycan-binding domain-containing protein n=1 Tax=Zeaxanthinibacter TaxID=561554 RepID=UPI00234921E6|nr:LysM peptidoglycan-binding domain-containing protein [Zeaxanthinibacter sp. PT1]MDC6352001.1 LysM peptidoglycan-binding domain-containing protein [Zeaxanthinibacter sp. PT1]
MYRKCLMLLVFLLISLQAVAQQFTTHAVKEGETLYGIAKKYRVTPFNILKFNKELKKDAPLRPNTILVIPLDSKAAETNIVPSDMVKKKEVVPPQEEPVEFKVHRVRKRETLFGIARNYNITEEDIKRYNTALYSSQLDKGMRLQIPVYADKSDDEVDEELDNFETYTVKPKETRWSIAHRYGITIDSMLSLNPELSRANNNLAAGQQLVLPKIPGSSVGEQKVDYYISYTVPPKKTLYSLSQEYGMSSEEIVRLNPEIMDRGGLKEGMVIRLPKKQLTGPEVNAENYVFYEVKPKQTTFSLTRNLGIGYDELLELNPELALGLKAGMILKLPKERSFELEVKNSLVLDKINLVDSLNRRHRPRLVYILPFRLDKMNFSDEELALKTLQSRNDIKYSLGLYSGALVALDSIAELGMSVDVVAYDNQLSLDKTKEILRNVNFGQVDAVFGPLDQSSLEEVAVQAAGQEVPVIAPVPLNSKLSLGNVFFSYTSDEILRKRMLEFMGTQVTDQNVIVIADDKNRVTKAEIMKKFPRARSLAVIEEEKNISIDLEALQELLSETQENWVFVESSNFKLISSVTSILNSVNTTDIKVRMFTTNKNKGFENPVISGSHLSNLSFTYPSAYREDTTEAFTKRYVKRFGGEPDKYAIRGFDLTLDLLLKLGYKLDLFEASRGIGTTQYSGNKFNFVKDPVSGYFNTSSYILMYNNMKIEEVKPQP